MLELLLFALIGIALGIIAGIIPGLHVNTIALLMLGLAPAFGALPLAVAVIAMAISTTFFDFIPSTLLAAPDPETALSVLPGHRLLMEGRGLEAIYLAMLGGLCAMVFVALLFPLMLILIPAFYSLVQGYIAWLLIGMSAFCVLSEKGVRPKAWSLAILLLSGALGFLALNSYSFSDALFPMFTGLFGTASLLFSLRQPGNIPAQNLKPRPPPRKLLASGVLKGVFSGALVGTLPAMGAAQATMLTQQMTGSGRDPQATDLRKPEAGKDKEYLISIGAINTIVALFSLVSLYTIAKARSGTAMVVGTLLHELGSSDLIVMLGVALLATGISALLLMRTARGFVRSMSGVSYPVVSKAILAFLVALVFIFTGLPGLLLLAVSTAIGLLAPLSGTKRSTAMGCLMVPLILFYAGV